LCTLLIFPKESSTAPGSLGTHYRRAWQASKPRILNQDPLPKCKRLGIAVFVVCENPRRVV